MSTENASDATLMAIAMEEARRGVGLTSPNPPVGAVVAVGDQVIGKGHHRKAGGPHAEIEALTDARRQNPAAVRGATIYVTLEPCSTQGRTPPCTKAILEAGIARVVYGAHDPNPEHRGRAEAVLADAGIAVTTGILEEACTALIRPFSKWITTGLPFVIAKAGQSLDGRITRPPGESSWITNAEARAVGRQLRARCDAIIVGAQTVRDDNPLLTLRPGEAPSEKVQPWRVVLTRSGDLPSTSHLFTDAFNDRTLVLRGLTLREALLDLGRRGVVTALIEGGGDILGQAFRDQLVDEVHWFIAPRICGGGRPSIDAQPELPASIPLRDTRIEMLGDNIHVSGSPVYDAPIKS